VGVAVIFAAVCLGLSVPLTFAAEVKDCEQQVLDLTNGHVLSDDGSIQSAIATLTSQGVDVRVRAFDTTPANGDLDAYEASQIQSCPSWGVNGHIKPSLLVVLDGLDHHDAVYYGSNFGPSMQPEVDNIRGAMQSPNQQGQFAKAVATALKDSSEVIKGNQDPATMTGGLSSEAWFWIISAAVILLVVGVIWWVRSGRGGGGYGGGGGYYFFGGGGNHNHSGSYGGGYGGGDGGSSGSW